MNMRSLLLYKVNDLLKRCVYKDRHHHGMNVILPEAKWLVEKFGNDEEGLMRNVEEMVRGHKPIQYVLGDVAFGDAMIVVRPPVLIPRPETEYWTEWLLKNRILPVLKGKEKDAESDVIADADGDKPMQMRILDACCGSGCVGIGIAKHLLLNNLHENVKITSIDIDPKAIALTKENRELNEIPSSMMEIIETDVLKYRLEDNNNNNNNNDNDNNVGFDIICINPPYISPKEYLKLPNEVLLWESSIALKSYHNHDNNNDEDHDGIDFIKKFINHLPHLVISADNVKKDDYNSNNSNNLRKKKTTVIMETSNGKQPFLVRNYIQQEATKSNPSFFSPFRSLSRSVETTGNLQVDIHKDQFRRNRFIVFDI